MNMMTTTDPRDANALGEVISWLDHEASLLEILTYRLNGLTNVLRSSRHSMVCTAASDVETVHDQLIRAAVHRDLALMVVAPNFGEALPTATELDELASDAERHALQATRARLDEILDEVATARDECARAADSYRPTPR